MAYFSNKLPPTPGEQLPMPHSATAAIVKEPELKPSLKRKNVEKSEAGMSYCYTLSASLYKALCLSCLGSLCDFFSAKEKQSTAF